MIILRKRPGTQQDTVRRQAAIRDGDVDVVPAGMWDSSGRRADKSIAARPLEAASIRTNVKINISAHACVFLAWRYPVADLIHLG